MGAGSGRAGVVAGKQGSGHTQVYSGYAYGDKQLHMRVPEQAAQRAAAERKRCAEEEASVAARERVKRMRLEDDVKVFPVLLNVFFPLRLLYVY